MGIGISIFLLAAGAVLAFGIDLVAEGVNLDAIGIILMVVGGLGLLYSLVVANAWGRDRVAAGGTDRAVTRERDIV